MVSRYNGVFLMPCSWTDLLVTLIVCGSAAVCTGAVETVSVNLTKPGDTVLLRCITSPDENITSWFRSFSNGTSIDLSRGDDRVTVANNNLTIIKAGENDVGRYMCLVKGTNYTVNLNSAPVIKPFDHKSINLVEKETLKLKCNAWGYPNPTLLWVRQTIDTGINSIITNDNDSRSDVSDQSTVLTYVDMTMADYQKYFCVAENELGKSNASTLVRVKDNLAPLWPFIGICIEVFLLVIVIIVYEKRRAKQQQDEAHKEETVTLTNSADHSGKDDVRSRK